MRSSFLKFLALCLFIVGNNYAQIGLPKINENDPTLPAWVEMMYSETPNAWEVDKGYNQHLKEHGKKTLPYESYYKRWRKYVQDYIDNKGFVHYPTVEERDSEIEFRQSLRDENRGSAVWNFIGPKVHLRGRYNMADSVPQASWHANIYSITMCIANPNIMYCGTEAGGVYKSTNHGNSWNFVVPNLFVRDVKSIEVHPTNPDIVFFGAAGKIYKSTDGGNNWAPCGQPAFQSTNIYTWDLHFNPANPNIIYAATSQGLYRSTNLGDFWTEVLTNECISVVTKPFDPSVVYTIQYNPTTKIGDFYKSLDSGLTYTIKPTGWFTVPAADAGLLESKGGRIGVSEADPNKVYSLLVGSSTGAASLQLNGYIGIYVSNDAGESWANPHGTIGSPYDVATHPNPMTFGGDDNSYNQIYYNTTISVSQLNANEIILGGLSMWRSTDGGANITPVGGYVGNIPYIHPDMQEIKTYKTGVSTQETWVACDGGLNYSINFVQNHVAKNNGIGASDYWGFDQGWNEDIMIGGRYHNGNAAYFDNYTAGEFISLGGGEASTGYANYSNEREVICSDIGGRIVPNNITDVITGFPIALSPNEGYWLNESSRIVYDRDYWNIAYLGNENKFYKSYDGGSSFSLLYSFGANTNDRVLWIEQSKSNPQIMYAQVVISNNSRIYKTTNGGTSWSTITIPQTNQRYLFFTISATNENELWVAYTSGTNGNKVYHTTNAGTSWTNITTPTLNGMEIYQITHQAGTDGGVYIAIKEGAVFYKNNTLTDWYNYSAGLPVAIEPLRLVPFYKGQKMRLACKGHSIWEADFYEPSQLIADFSADYKEFYCPGDTIHFNDHSVATAAATYQWTFTGGSPSTSTLKYPSVVYGSSGSFDVQLIVTDGAMIDTIIKNVFIQSTPNLGTFASEGFENPIFPPTGWKNPNDGFPGNWLLNDGVGGYAASSQSMYFDNYFNDVQGNRDQLYTAKYDFTIQYPTYLTFDVAYSEYGGQYSDTLAVLASADCGNTFDTLYVKGGGTLATAPSFTADIFIPTAGQWRTDSIDISNYADNPELLFAFENRGRWGQAIYVDNINISTYNAAGLNENNNHWASNLYPNPAGDLTNLHVVGNSQGEFLLSIFNSLGQMFMQQTIILEAGEQNILLNTSTMAEGIYQVVLRDRTEIKTSKKLLIIK